MGLMRNICLMNKEVDVQEAEKIVLLIERVLHFCVLMNLLLQIWELYAIDKGLKLSFKIFS